MNIGAYRLLGTLGRGGMGVVHLAERQGPHGFAKLCAVKELTVDVANDEVHREMFIEEARLAARLRHPNIVETYELGCDEGRWFMAMELLEGASLHDVRTRLGRRLVPARHAARVLASVLDALAYAHALGVVHRDVSALNVFLTWTGEVKLIDFGVAKSRRARMKTKAGIVKGSIPYLSPDHLEPSTIDGRADVFSVGVLLRELVTGERFWGEADDMTILRRLIARDLPAWPSSSAENPQAAAAALRAIAERATAARREDRYASAAAMRADLDAFLLAYPGDAKDHLGTWLSRELADDKAASAFRIAAAEQRDTPTWLPSSDLATQVVAVPEPRRRSPPPPPLPRRARSPRWVPARALLATGALLVAAAAGLLGASAGNRHASTSREPRALEDHVSAIVAPARVLAAPEPVAQAEPNARESPDSASRAASAPLYEHASLPPNPYGQ